jgi:hypothetical protein
MSYDGSWIITGGNLMFCLAGEIEEIPICSIFITLIKIIFIIFVIY